MGDPSCKEEPSRAPPNPDEEILYWGDIVEGPGIGFPQPPETKSQRVAEYREGTRRILAVALVLIFGIGFLLVLHDQLAGGKELSIGDYLMAVLLVLGGVLAFFYRRQ